MQNVGENYFYQVSQEFNASVPDLLKKGCFCYDYCDSLENSKKSYLSKINFIIHWIIMQLVIKIINIILMFGNLLKWTLWKIIMTFT